MTRESLFGVSPAIRDAAWGQVPTKSDARNLTSCITATNVSDEAVDNIAEAMTLLSESHTKTAPGELLTDVTRLHELIQGLLRAGKQRLRQTHDLFRIDADLLAHGSLLLGDLYFDDAAAGYGSAALLCAAEADSNPAIAYSVQAKSERWRQHFAQSADLARQGFDHSPQTSVRILLASQEAHAAAIVGDTRRAREALHRAEDAAAGPIAPDSGTSAWSCPRPRQALFALAVAIRLGDPDSALRAVEMADAAWASGTPLVTATWAQVRLAAGIAHIMKGDLDGTLAEFTPSSPWPRNIAWPPSPATLPRWTSVYVNAVSKTTLWLWKLDRRYTSSIPLPLRLSSIAGTVEPPTGSDGQPLGASRRARAGARVSLLARPSRRSTSGTGTCGHWARETIRVFGSAFYS
jgi:hypothetical protein